MARPGQQVVIKDESGNEGALKWLENPVSYKIKALVGADLFNEDGTVDTINPGDIFTYTGDFNENNAMYSYKSESGKIVQFDQDELDDNDSIETLEIEKGIPFKTASENDNIEKIKVLKDLVLASTMGEFEWKEQNEDHPESTEENIDGVHELKAGTILTYGGPWADDDTYNDIYNIDGTAEYAQIMGYEIKEMANAGLVEILNDKESSMDWNRDILNKKAEIMGEPDPSQEELQDLKEQGENATEDVRFDNEMRKEFIGDNPFFLYVSKENPKGKRDIETNRIKKAVWDSNGDWKAVKKVIFQIERDFPDSGVTDTDSMTAIAYFFETYCNDNNIKPRGMDWYPMVNKKAEIMGEPDPDELEMHKYLTKGKFDDKYTLVYMPEEKYPDALAKKEWNADSGIQEEFPSWENYRDHRTKITGEEFRLDPFYKDQKKFLENYVKEHGINHLWTVIDNDEGKEVALPGQWSVNRMYYILTNEPWMSENESYYF